MLLKRPHAGMVHLFLGCCSGGLETRLVAVDADDRRDVEIELVELLDKFLDPRARPHLAVARADVVGFDKKSSPWADIPRPGLLRGRSGADVPRPGARRR